MKHTKLVLASLVFVFVSSVASHADSDGYFCASKGYLAYEVRQGVTLGAVGHVLKVVRFDLQRGIRNAGAVTLRDFQVHVLTCSEESIVIAGYGTVATGNPPLTKCVIQVGSPENGPSILECKDDPTVQHDWRTEGPAPHNLGQWARMKSIPLESPDPDHQYHLLLDVSDTNMGEATWEMHYKTELIQADARGNVSQRLVLYEARLIVSDSGD
jgi:hypothetical protein